MMRVWENTHCFWQPCGVSHTKIKIQGAEFGGPGKLPMDWIGIPKNYTLGVSILKNYTPRERVNQNYIKLQARKTSFDFLQKMKCYYFLTLKLFPSSDKSITTKRRRRKDQVPKRARGLSYTQ